MAMTNLHPTDRRIVRSDLTDCATDVGRTVAVVGLGYVGLPTALSFLASGSAVIGFDASAQRIARIRDDNVDLRPADHARLRTFRDSPRFRMVDQPEHFAEADTIVICVPTPVDDHQVPDLTALEAACATVVKEAIPGQTIVLTSTSYAGTTTDLLVSPLTARGFQVGRDIYVAFSPERIDPGSVRAQEQIPRVVGGVTSECLRRAVAVISRTASFVCPVCSPEAAEMVKLLENTFRAVNIALANEFADASRDLGLDPLEIIEAAATKPYGFMPFYPGPGVGGHCIPCDPHYLLWQMRALHHHLPLIDAAMTAVAGRPSTVADRAAEVLAASGKRLSGARVLVLGVTYKPGVADVRESPALEVMRKLVRAGADLAYADPLIPSLTVEQTTLVSTVDPTADRWDLVLVHTLHPDVDMTWLQDQDLVLDATYRLTELKQRLTL